MRSYVSLLSTRVPALLAGAEDTATSPDMRDDENQSHSRRRFCESSPETLPRLGDECQGAPALAVIRGITDINGALAWRALITRYGPNTEPRVHSLNVKNFSSELTANEIALDEWL